MRGPLQIHSFLILPITASALPPPSPISAGHWSVNISGSSSVSGYRWHNLYSVHSLNPKATVSCNWLFRADLRNASTTCSDTSFSYTWSGWSGYSGESSTYST